MLSGLNLRAAYGKHLLAARLEKLRMSDLSPGQSLPEAPPILDEAHSDPWKPGAVCIIGAGAAGLMAAKELSLSGKKIAVIEARNRIGGRIDTVQAPGFLQPADRGADPPPRAGDDDDPAVQCAAHENTFYNLVTAATRVHRDR